MSKFEKLTPAFHAEAFDQHREAALSGEQREVSTTAQQLSEFVRAVDALDEKNPEAAKNLVVEGAPAYHYDEEGNISLHVGLELKYSDKPCILINGQFKNEGDSNPSDVFGIYKVTADGELFRSDPDNFETHEEGYWKKVSLNSQKDTRRVEEVKSMLGSITGNGEEIAQINRAKAAQELRQTQEKLNELLENDMANDVVGFKELHQTLLNAMQLKRTVVRTPAQSLEFKSANDRVAKKLEAYGIDSSLTSQVEGMYEATRQTLKDYDAKTHQAGDLEQELEAARQAQKVISELNIEG